MHDERMVIAADAHEIEMLQRLYAKATDRIGLGTAAAVAEGRAIYHRIFTGDVQIRTANTGGDPLVARGPDAWAEIVQRSLNDYMGTQHLIGTQIAEVQGDEGQLESYLNAWHKKPDGSVFFFLGTYISLTRRTPEGWKICDMTLRHDSSGTIQTGS